MLQQYIVRLFFVFIPLSIFLMALLFHCFYVNAFYSSFILCILFHIHFVGLLLASIRNVSKVLLLQSSLEINHRCFCNTWRHCMQRLLQLLGKGHLLFYMHNRGVKKMIIGQVRWRIIKVLCMHAPNASYFDIKNACVNSDPSSDWCYCEWKFPFPLFVMLMIEHFGEFA